MFFTPTLMASIRPTAATATRPRGYRNWWVVAACLGFVVVAFGMIRYPLAFGVRRAHKPGAWFPRLVFAFSLMIAGLTFWATNRDYLWAVNILRSGRYQVVEGTVRD